MHSVGVCIIQHPDFSFLFSVLHPKTLEMLLPLGVKSTCTKSESVPHLIFRSHLPMLVANWHCPSMPHRLAATSGHMKRGRFHNSPDILIVPSHIGEILPDKIAFARSFHHLVIGSQIAYRNNLVSSSDIQIMLIWESVSWQITLVKGSGGRTAPFLYICLYECMLHGVTQNDPRQFKYR
jgi:hypothetical protein